VRLVVDTMEYAAKTMPRYNRSASRLPHSRSGLDCRAGAGIHAGWRALLRDEAVKRGLVRRLRRTARSFFWTYTTISSKRSANCARRVACGAHDARLGRLQGPALVDDACAQPDGRCEPDGATAGQQHCAHGDSGAGGDSRRHAVAAYELEGRGVSDSFRRSDQDRGSHAADPGAGESAWPMWSIRSAARTTSSR
jgi:hypothetical protein